ncbi:MAG: hypothetical protein Q9222_002026 [Ikaeria aurantiellina]
MESGPPVQGVEGVSPRAVKVIVISVVFLPFAALAIALRLWARRLKRMPLALNDYLIIAAMVFAIGETVTIILAVTMGKVGYHISELSLDQIIALGKVMKSVRTVRCSLGTKK